LALVVLLVLLAHLVMVELDLIPYSAPSLPLAVVVAQEGLVEIRELLEVRAEEPLEQALAARAILHPFILLKEAMAEPEALVGLNMGVPVVVGLLRLALMALALPAATVALEPPQLFPVAL